MINWVIGCLRPNGIRLPERRLTKQWVTSLPNQYDPTFHYQFLSVLPEFDMIAHLSPSLFWASSHNSHNDKGWFSIFLFVRQLHSDHFILIKWVIPLLILFYFYFLRIIYFFHFIVLCSDSFIMTGKLYFNIDIVVDDCTDISLINLRMIISAYYFILFFNLIDIFFINLIE